MKRKQAIIREHLAHGVELYHSNSSQHVAEYRCEGCGIHLCWASESDVKNWHSYGVELKPAVKTKQHLTLVWNKGGNY